MTLKITKVVVLLLPNRTDQVILHTEFPSPFPLVHNDPMHASFEVQKDKGIEYVRSFFGMEPEVIDAR